MILYRAPDDTGQTAIGGHTSRLGLVSSSDGIHFSKLPLPVFFATKDAQQSREWPGGVEDPRLVKSQDGTFVLTYTLWNRKTYTVGVATSKDLQHWTRYGPIFADAGGRKSQHLAYKSAGILTQNQHGHPVAALLNGKYWIYWGEIQIRLATSTDLIHWNPVEDVRGSPKVILEAQGIVLLYRGKNARERGDPSISPGAYSAGQALFSINDPPRLIDRLEPPYLKPELPFEKAGQYAAGTVFTEGLALSHDKWWLFYGTADSLVGVATSPAVR